MFRNLLKISIRNLSKNRAYTLVNVIGLSLSIACSLILLLLIDFELSFDDYHRNKERIYRITQHMQRSEGIQYSSDSQYAMAKSLRNDFPDLSEVTMVEYHNTPVITVKHEDGSYSNFSESETAAFVEPEFLKIFDFEILAGSAEKALYNISGALVSKSKVKKYFGLEDSQLHEAIGKNLTIDSDLEITINAVIDDLPHNSDFPFTLRAPLKTLSESQRRFEALDLFLFL